MVGKIRKLELEVWAQQCCWGHGRRGADGSMMVGEEGGGGDHLIGRSHDWKRQLWGSDQIRVCGHSPVHHHSTNI